MRGPLKVLKEYWLEEDDQVSLLEKVSQLCHRITRVGEIARVNLKVSQRKMKTWYDQRAQQRIFKAGDNFLKFFYQYNVVDHLQLKRRLTM